MTGIIRLPTPTTCARCLRVSRGPLIYTRRHASFDASSKSGGDNDGNEPSNTTPSDDAPGAMTRRLQELSDESLQTGGRSARKAVEEAGFGEELKKALEQKIADAQFRSDNAKAFSQVGLPQGADKATRDIAGARPWMGTESVEDAALRMLNDAHKPLRVASSPPSIRGPPSKIDTGRPRGKMSAGSRIASARERSSLYEQQQEQQGLTDEEREKFRREMQQRFMPGARAVASVQGLTSLANERIEDAIARGQFKNLPDRGKKIERDYNANSPFINTTEYFMNKLIKKQEIVPPWIEKQQEVISTATTFRRRLRADWKRHVSRSIASHGGSLDSQMKLADEYAFAEMLEVPTSKKVEQMHVINDGQLSQLTLSGELKTTPHDDATALEEEIKVMEQTFNDDGSLKPAEERVSISTETPLFTQAPPPEPPRRATVPPYRDSQWEETESSYHKLAIQNLNSLTRSYNLMAPNLAKKPYFSLERELLSCYADVAPQVAAAIRERAFAPKVKGVEVVGHKPGGVLDKFSVDRASHVYDERKPQYGFKEFWKDLFSSKA